MPSLPRIPVRAVLVKATELPFAATGLAFRAAGLGVSGVRALPQTVGTVVGVGRTAAGIAVVLVRQGRDQAEQDRARADQAQTDKAQAGKALADTAQADTARAGDVAGPSSAAAAPAAFVKAPAAAAPTVPVTAVAAPAAVATPAAAPPVMAPPAVATPATASPAVATPATAPPAAAPPATAPPVAATPATAPPVAADTSPPQSLRRTPEPGMPMPAAEAVAVGAPGAATEEAEAAEVEAVEHGLDLESALDHEALPIPGYDQLTVGSLRPKIRRLDLDELLTLRAYEQAHAKRIQVITMLENRIARLRKEQQQATSTGTPPSDPQQT